jgi:protein-S-isoprenylcysteine O-methyltransferase Ste14
MLLSSSQIIFLFGFVFITAVRTYASLKYRPPDGPAELKDPAEKVLLSLIGLAMLVPLLVIFTKWLTFAGYVLPEWTAWPGGLLFLAAIWLLYRSHRDLGKNWSPQIEILEGQQLVQSGVYAHWRHPMYTAHLYWALAQPLLVHNWIGGFSLLLVMIPFLMYRVPREEKLLVEEFGEEYEALRRRTGWVLPRF